MVVKYFKVQLLIIFSLSHLLAKGDNQNNVEGTVRSKETGIPLHGANVELIGKNSQQYGATTDVNGGFNIDGIENGRPPEISAEMGLKAKAVAEAIYESGIADQAVNYDDVVSGKIETYQKPINEKQGL